MWEIARSGRIVVLAISASAQMASAAGTIKSMPDLSHALRTCLAPQVQARPGIAVSIRMSFRRDGELLGTPFVFFPNLNLSNKKRQNYRAAVVKALKACTPLPFAGQFGTAMAGYPITIHLMGISGRTITL